MKLINRNPVTEAEWKSLYRYQNGTRKETGQEWAEVILALNKLTN